MPDQPADMNKNRNAVRLALGAAIGSALGIITAVRSLTAGRRGQDRATIAPPETAMPNAVRVRMADDRIPIDDTSIRENPAQPAPRPDVHPDWERLPPAHRPRPTSWPGVLAVAIVFLAWGVVTTIAISAVGLVLFALALGGWIGELRHGHE
jgi:hypothetical protein